MDKNKAIDELPILRDFIDFVNQQVGVYSDCLSGFAGNKVRIERQVASVSRPTSRRIENGQPVIVWTSVEDPDRPDVIHNRIVRADKFISANSEAGANERHVCWSNIVFVFSYWDEQIRPQIADVRGVDPRKIRLDVMGDLRIVRHAIIHNKGILEGKEYLKLKVMHELFKPDIVINPTHDEMHKIFVRIKQSIAELILHYSGGLPGAPSSAELVDIAIQTS